MAYRLRPEKPSGSEITRVIREQIKRATRAASDTGASRARRVHFARTSCKKIRAALQLVRPACPGIWRRENAWFRDSARILAPLRDAAVIASTFAALLRHFEAGVEPRTFDAIRRQLLAHRRRLMPHADKADRRLSRFAKRMRAAAQRVSKWKLQNIGATLVVEGFGDTYRRARRAWRDVGNNPSTRAFHEWRKHAKAHAYHHRLLRGARPSVMRAWQLELETLGRQLGEEHDLAALDCHLRDHAGEFSPPASTDSLRGLIKARRDDLRAGAIASGARLFAEKPAALQRRLRTWWNAARQPGGGGIPHEPSAR